MSKSSYLSAADIAALPGDGSLHAVNSNVDRVTRSLGDATGLTGMGVLVFETAPGADTTAFHRHHFEDEAIYVLSGTAQAQVGEDVFDIGPGDFLGHPKGGLPHIIRNTGSEVLRCLVMGERRDHDVIDYPEAGKRLTRTDGKAEDWSEL